MIKHEEFKKFLSISYDELEIMNLAAKERQTKIHDPEKHKEHYISYLEGETGLKAVTLCFSDLEGRFHMLDYDKKFFLKSHENLTFDGSSIRGFTMVHQSDLRLDPDWASFRWLPSDIFGPGKVIMFAYIRDKDGELYISDMRAQLKLYLDQLRKKKNYSVQIGVECEGFLFEGINAEQNYQANTGFKLVSTGGYFNSLPKDPLKLFIDSFAEAKRAVGFENEKDHPEVAPSQFELNYSYCDALLAADEVLLYKFMARQVAANMGMTASFLPKPIQGINGSGMHTNMSIFENGKNIFFDKKGEERLSPMAWDVIGRLLHSANDLALSMGASVNAYRRQDPAFEAPNQIKASANDRTSMIRIPLGNEKSSRIEVRTVAPDCNPYLVFLCLIRTGLEGPSPDQIPEPQKRGRTRILPDNIYDAIRHFKSSDLMTQILGEETKEKYLNRKKESANRCPKELGKLVKTEEVIFHHEVTNQLLWSRF
jgi:glutamine synthetase